MDRRSFLRNVSKAIAVVAAIHILPKPKSVTEPDMVIIIGTDPGGCELLRVGGTVLGCNNAY